MCADRKKDIHSSVVISELSICWKTSSDTSANHTGSWSTCSSPSSSDRRSPTWRGGDTNPSICDIIFTLYFIVKFSTEQDTAEVCFCTTHPIWSPALMGLLEKKAIRGKRRSWCMVNTLTASRLGSHRWLMKRPMLPKSLASMQCTSPTWTRWWHKWS